MTTYRSPLQLALSVVFIAMVSAYEGYGTVYTLTSPSSGNCNFMNWPSDAATKYAALNAAQWEETMNCGRCAEVSCTDASCAGQSSEIVYIMDQCPGCEYGDLDLSPDVFESITGQSYTKLSIEWKFVDCPISNNVQYCLKTGSSEFWVAVQPANFVSGVQSLSINGQETSVIDSAYYFLIDGMCVADLSSVSISLTGVNGEVIEETLSLTADECTEGAKQFATSDTTSQSTILAGSSGKESTTTKATDAPTLAPTATPTPTPTPKPIETKSPVVSTLRSSSASDTNDKYAVVSSSNKTEQVSDDSESNIVQVTVTKTPTAVQSTTSRPTHNESSDDVIQSNVQSSGNSHSTPLMIGMIVVVCAAVVVAVGLALYVRRRKQQIDSYKRREEQGTAMSDADMSPRASDASSTYDIVHSPAVHFVKMESMEGRI
ncbi:hypothetical protein PHMEG_00029068 [Phytophthora megakarya]|uniref:Expansin-like EG45 domain-containing protein n=1 Tax=Phytophthora megakarya TaxID=4795 RepID=A0A225V4F3_9STRA|nr:hypothetical protein PHMEG_00029068 [Phytophthora megakarya]